MTNQPETDCPTPETHNWGCGCPTDVAAAIASCPGHEVDGPSPCRCPCEGCKHNCAAHQSAAVSAAVAPPTNDTHGLSVQHADALYDAIATPGPARESFDDQHARVCAVVRQILDDLLPTPAEPTDRAAVLHEVADELTRKANKLTERVHDLAYFVAKDRLREAEILDREATELRRMADETATETPDDTLHACPGRWGGPGCRCFDDQPAAGARQDEPTVTVHAAPDMSPAAEEALGALIDVAKQQATDGWQGATEVISDAEVQRLAATGLVGYRQGRGQLLHCLHHKPVPASRWADFHEVTADDLPDGGICVHPRCGADLLAVQPAAGARQDGATS